MQSRTYANEGLKYLFNQVNDLLIIASEYNGVAYGGYVRDVVSSRELCDRSFEQKTY